MRTLFVSLILLASWTGTAEAALEAVYGLEFVKMERVYDPAARPEQLLLVSGSLKLTGGLRGNLWEMITYIPQKTASPRTDRGHFQSWGDQLKFFSHLTFGTYTARIIENGDRIVINKVARDGRSQREVWYIVR
jgi:hypothetical protein